MMPSLPPKADRIVNDRRLRRAQHIHTAIATAAGASGVIACAALALFVKPVSWLDLGIFTGMFLLVGIGLTVGYHRHFTHRSFKTSPFIRGVLGILGCSAGQGPVVFWVALHRLHHEFSDREGDPHSPNMHGTSRWQRVQGLVYAYIGWTVQHEVPNANFYARDLLADSLIRRINQAYLVWVALGLAAPAAVGGLVTGSWLGALEGFLWGGLVRMFALHNMIWWITSLAHAVGTHDLDSRDFSTNNLWLALPTLGESWHNNHHSFPTAASLRFEWWQIDPSGTLIALMERLGLVWDVEYARPDMVRARQLHG